MTAQCRQYVQISCLAPWVNDVVICSSTRNAARCPFLPALSQARVSPNHSCSLTRATRCCQVLRGATNLRSGVGHIDQDSRAATTNQELHSAMLYHRTSNCCPAWALVPNTAGAEITPCHTTTAPDRTALHRLHAPHPIPSPFTARKGTAPAVLNPPLPRHSARHHATPHCHHSRPEPAYTQPNTARLVPTTLTTPPSSRATVRQRCAVFCNIL